VDNEDGGWPSVGGRHGAPNERAKVAEIEVFQPKPTPLRKRTKLADVRQIRAELSRVYRQAKAGEIDTTTATRLAYMLDLMSRMIERGELENRIELLEAERHL
jgi:hypothetical protein